jgi:hypothetical protein
VTIEHLWLSVPVVLVAWFGFLLKLRLVDFWWHLKIGEIIVNTRTLPRVDSFSFTAGGNEFVLQNWLFEVICHLIYLAGGFPLLIAANAALLVGALVPVYHLCRKATDNLRLSVVASLVAAIPLLYFGSVRSQVFSFAFFSFYYWTLSNYRVRARGPLWSLPLLMVVWVNFHGAFVLGIGLIVLFLVFESVRHLMTEPGNGVLSKGEVTKLGLVLALSVAATFINPEALGVYSYVGAVASNPASQLFVLEWQAPKIDDVEGVLLFYGPLFITLLVLLYAKQRPELIEMALVLVFAVFGLTAIRNGVWFVLIAAPIVSRYLPLVDWPGLASAFRRLRVGEAVAVWIQRRRASPAPVRYRLNAQIVIVMLVITVLVSPWVYPRLRNKLLGTALWEATTPVGAMDYLDRNNLEGNTFHPQIYGDYLIWRLWPRQRSFVDGRVHVFDLPVIRDYRLAFVDSHWEERLAKYDIRYLLLSKEEEENRMMLDSARASANWKVLYEDHLSVLFEKN